jgi:tRNA A37 threonylcarbamoyladenosine dehydratase
MLNEFSRSQLLLGEEGLDKLKKSTVAVFGVGGVGGFTVEALARTGVGTLVLVDDDEVCLTNINRQIIATHQTIGRPKVEVMKERILDINPNANVTIHRCFFGEDTLEQFNFSSYSYVVDAIDTVSSKILLIETAKAHNVPIMSSMGAGNKLDPTRFEVTDIYKTSVCPLAKVMRHKLKERRIKKLKVVYSKEPALKPLTAEAENYKNISTNPLYKENSSIVKRQTPGSIAFVPSVAGLIIAGEVIKDLVKA